MLREGLPKMYDIVGLLFGTLVKLFRTPASERPPYQTSVPVSIVEQASLVVSIVT